MGFCVNDGRSMSLFASVLISLSICWCFRFTGPCLGWECLVSSWLLTLLASRGPVVSCLLDRLIDSRRWRRPKVHGREHRLVDRCSPLRPRPLERGRRTPGAAPGRHWPGDLDAVRRRAGFSTPGGSQHEWRVNGTLPLVVNDAGPSTRPNFGVYSRQGTCRPRTWSGGRE